MIEARSDRDNHGTHILRRVELAEANSERDLGVVINIKLKKNEQIDQATFKVNLVLGMLKRTFVH